MTKIVETALPGVLEITPPRFGDDRGWFSETWNKSKFLAAGLDLDFVQDNESLTRETGSVRGLHFQRPPNAQGKLVRVAAGSVFDVAVDIRKGSPTYGKWVGVVLSAELGNQLWVPEGFLHGFMTLEPNVRLVYKVTGRYSKADEGGVRFDDPEIGIQWPIEARYDTLSPPDRAAPLLSEIEPAFEFGK
jgi:dTDP-4-dehydrorhamnose 3,5-epimerase